MAGAPVSSQKDGLTPSLSTQNYVLILKDFRKIVANFGLPRLVNKKGQMMFDLPLNCNLKFTDSVFKISEEDLHSEVQGAMSGSLEKKILTIMWLGLVFSEENEKSERSEVSSEAQYYSILHIIRVLFAHLFEGMLNKSPDNIPVKYQHHLNILFFGSPTDDCDDALAGLVRELKLEVNPRTALGLLDDDKLRDILFFANRYKSNSASLFCDIFKGLETICAKVLKGGLEPTESDIKGYLDMPVDFTQSTVIVERVVACSASTPVRDATSVEAEENLACSGSAEGGASSSVPKGHVLFTDRVGTSCYQNTITGSYISVEDYPKYVKALTKAHTSTRTLYESLGFFRSPWAHKVPKEGDEVIISARAFFNFQKKFGWINRGTERAPDE